MCQQSKQCPHCGEKIQTEATRCERCGEWLKDQPCTDAVVNTGPTTELPTRAGGIRYSNAQPIWHLVIFWITTLGFYSFYWFYRNWKHLREHKDQSIRPGWRLVALFIPYVNFCFMYQQLGRIRDYARDAGIKRRFRRDAVLTGIIVLAMPYNVAAYHSSFHWMLLFAIPWLLPFLSVQRTLNLYWQSEQAGLPIQRSLNWKGITTVVVGGILTFLVVLGSIVESNVKTLDETARSVSSDNQLARYVDETEWSDYSYDMGHISVSFPAQPERDTSSKKLSGGNVTVVTYKCHGPSGNVTYLVSWRQLPIGPVRGRNAEEFLQSVAEDSARHVNGTILEETPSSCGEYDGKEYLIDGTQAGTKMRIRERLYLVGQRIYTAMCVTEKGYTDPDEDRFLDSLSLAE